LHVSTPPTIIVTTITPTPTVALLCLPASGAADGSDIPLLDLELGYDHLAKFWSGDERWSGAREELRRRLWRERFGGAMEQAASARKVRGEWGVGCRVQERVEYVKTYVMAGETK
jgi:hypothetical protein